jgi:hypothetical protein
MATSSKRTAAPTADDLADWPVLTIPAIARRLNCRPDAIRDRALALGIRAHRAPSGRLLFTMNDLRRLAEGVPA